MRLSQNYLIYIYETVTKLFGIYKLYPTEWESQTIYKLSLNFMVYILLLLVYEEDSMHAKTCDKKC